MRRRGPRLAALPGLAVATPAVAHTSSDVLGSAWAWGSLWVLLPLLAAMALYLRGWWCRIRAGGWSSRHAVRANAFAAGILVLALALTGPLDAWVETSFAAHMGQHMLLVAVVPPLLLAGRPQSLWLRALPPAARRCVTMPARHPVLAARWRRFARSPAATGTLHGAAIWIWHAPAAFEAALRSDTVHWLEHLTLWASALLFWRALHSLRSQPWTALGWLLLTVIHTGMLGALLTLAPAPLYPLYAARSSAADALADQQLAGLIMWVPMGTAYLVAALGLAARALGREPPAQASRLSTSALDEAAPEPARSLLGIGRRTP